MPRNATWRDFGGIERAVPSCTSKVASPARVCPVEPDRIRAVGPLFGEDRRWAGHIPVDPRSVRASGRASALPGARDIRWRRSDPAGAATLVRYSRTSAGSSWFWAWP